MARSTSTPVPAPTAEDLKAQLAKLQNKADGTPRNLTARQAKQATELQEQIKALSGTRARKTPRQTRDARLGNLAKHATNLAQSAGFRLADRVAAGNVRAADGRVGATAAEVKAYVGGCPRAALLRFAAGEIGRSDLPAACQEALKTFAAKGPDYQRAPFEFNGRRGAAILVALMDDRAGRALMTDTPKTGLPAAPRHTAPAPAPKAAPTKKQAPAKKAAAPKKAPTPRNAKGQIMPAAKKSAPTARTRATRAPKA